MATLKFNDLIQQLYHRYLKISEKEKKMKIATEFLESLGFPRDKITVIYDPSNDVAIASISLDEDSAEYDMIEEMYRLVASTNDKIDKIKVVATAGGVIPARKISNSDAVRKLGVLEHRYKIVKKFKYSIDFFEIYETSIRGVPVFLYIAIHRLTPNSS